MRSAISKTMTTHPVSPYCTIEKNCKFISKRNIAIIVAKSPYMNSDIEVKNLKFI